MISHYIFLLFALFTVACHPKSDLPDPLAAEWNGQQVCEIIEDNDQVRVLKCTFPPGGGHDRHYHKPHWGYALSGSTFQITDQNGTRTVELKTGSDFSSNGVEWHEVINIGDSTSVYLIVEPK